MSMVEAIGTTMRVPEVEREMQRLAAAGEALVGAVTSAFDRFASVLDSTERPELNDRLAHQPVNTSVGAGLSSISDQIERQVERLQELRDRCEL